MITTFEDGMTATEQKQVAQAESAADFAERWTDRGYEKGEAQKFWLELLGDVVGVEHPTDIIDFEVPVQMDSTKQGADSAKTTTKFIDAYMPDTGVLIEQKGRDVNLRKSYKQSDGSMLTPFQQARRYNAYLPYNRRPRWIVVSNFQEIHIHDMNRPNDEPVVVALDRLAYDYPQLQFLVAERDEAIRIETEISIEAGNIVAKLYSALKSRYVSPDDKASLESLNMLCVRLVFCLYAEDAEIFDKGQFTGYLAKFDAEGTGEALIKLFQVLDQREEERSPYLPSALAAFPYVNGGLFAKEDIEIPLFTDFIRSLILDTAGGFDWSRISPTIFGAIFETTMDPDKRRAGGMHYTSIENIHKVIDPLFLNDLQDEFQEILELRDDNPQSRKKRNRKLRAFQEKLGSLTFLDPACGSGNFLTETYLSLRRLENQALEAQHKGQVIMDIGNPIKVSISQFHGIEINDFAVAVAQTALWIAENQTMRETEKIIQMDLDFLPLTTAAHIVESNALRLDWNNVVPARECSYVLGNPPFVGYSLQDKAQKKDVQSVFVDSAGNPLKQSGKIDYVAGWFFKTAEYMSGTSTRAAFVATNSITMGDQVAPIWEPLRKQFDTHIDFAWRTFVWGSEATDQAHVHVVIIGFSDSAPVNREKVLFFANGISKKVSSINPHLMEGEFSCIASQHRPISDVPTIFGGGKPAEGGNLILTDAEKDQLIKDEPQAGQFLRPFMMGKDFIDRKPRWCLWLVGADPAVLKKCPGVLKRVEAVRAFRAASTKAATRKKAETPTLFDEVRTSATKYIAIPKVSSERRKYIPMDYLNPNVVPGDMLFVIPDAELFHFGMLMSNVHMAWMRAFAGRLKSDYRYSNTLVYNNFPWPDPTPAQKAKIEKTAQAILDARALYPEASLADLYDENTMPPELRRAHQRNDMAVMEAYGFRDKDGHWLSESETVALLMQMYAELTTNTDN